MAEILRASDGKNYVVCPPNHQTFEEERLSKPTALPKFGDLSDSAKDNLPELSLTGLSEAENALLRFGGSNSRRLQMLADLKENDGGKVGEVTLEDLNAALRYDDNGSRRLSTEDRRAVEWMKKNMAGIADEDTLWNDGWAAHGVASIFQGVDLWDDDGISTKELSDFAAKRGATLDSARAAAAQLEGSEVKQSKGSQKVVEGTSQEADGKQEAVGKNGADGKKVSNDSSSSDIPGFVEWKTGIKPSKGAPEAVKDGVETSEEDLECKKAAIQMEKLLNDALKRNGSGSGKDGSTRAPGAGAAAEGADSVIQDFEITDSAPGADKAQGSTNEKDGMLEYTVAKGDSISNVASGLLEKTLGRAVTQAELRNYVNKVVEMNGFAKDGRKADLIFPGEVLKFPPLCEVPAKAEGDSQSPN